MRQHAVNNTCTIILANDNVFFKNHMWRNRLSFTRALSVNCSHSARSCGFVHGTSSGKIYYFA